MERIWHRWFFLLFAAFHFPTCGDSFYHIFFPYFFFVQSQHPFWHDKVLEVIFLFLFQDSTFEFERKRNRPERYDRNVAENTLTAIKKIVKVRVDREARHHKQRFIFFSNLCFKRIISCSIKEKDRTLGLSFLLNRYWKYLAGWRGRKPKSKRKQRGNWNRVSTWSKPHLLSKQIHLSLCRRTKSRCLPCKHSRINLWKSDFGTVFVSQFSFDLPKCIDCRTLFSWVAQLLFVVWLSLYLPNRVSSVLLKAKVFVWYFDSVCQNTCYS